MIKSFLSLASGNLISKALGLCRELLLAWAFGLSSTAAAVRIAIAAVFVPINFFTQELLAAAFIPVYKELRKKSIKEARDYTNFFFCFITTLGFLITLILWPVANSWIYLLASGFSSETAALATALFKPMILSIPFILLTSALSYRAMAEGQYFIQSLRPSIQNIGMILAILISYSCNSILMIGYGFLITQIAFSLLVIAWVTKQPWVTFSLAFIKHMKSFLKALWTTMKPLFYLPLALQGYILLERNVASWISESTVAALDATKFITETAGALLAIPMGLILLSNYSIADYENRFKLIEKIIAIVVVTITPLACILIFAPDTIISILFQRGEFTDQDTLEASAILRFFGFGILFHTLSYQLLKLSNAFLKPKLFSQATLVGIFAGSCLLLTYPLFGLRVFGFAYFANSLTVCLVLSKHLYSATSLIKSLTGSIFAILSTSLLASYFFHAHLSLHAILAICIILILLSITSGLVPFVISKGPSQTLSWLLTKKQD